MVLEIGMKAPNFSLNNHNGEKKINANYFEKKLVIYFYPKDDTPGCTKESCKFRDINFELNNLDCEVVGVSADGRESHEKNPTGAGARHARTPSMPGPARGGGRIAHAYNRHQQA